MNVTEQERTERLRAEVTMFAFIVLASLTLIRIVLPLALLLIVGTLVKRHTQMASKA